MKTPQRTTDPSTELNHIIEMLDIRVSEVNILNKKVDELINASKFRSRHGLMERNTFFLKKCEELKNDYNQMLQSSISILEKISSCSKSIEGCHKILKENEAKLEKEILEKRKKREENEELNFNNPDQIQPKCAPIKIHVKKCPANLDLNKDPNESQIELNDEEKKQINSWTNLRIGKVIFNSKKNRWCLKINSFPANVSNKKNLLFVIADDNQNKFGAYLGAEAKSGGDGMKPDNWVQDNTAFLFSLKYKGVNAFEKYPIAKPEETFCLYTSVAGFPLFSFGKGDLVLRAKPYHEQSCCSPFSFSYENKKESIFTETQENKLFKPIEFKVYQLE